MKKWKEENKRFNIKGQRKFQVKDKRWSPKKIDLHAQTFLSTCDQVYEAIYRIKAGNLPVVFQVIAFRIKRDLLSRCIQSFSLRSTPL